MLAGCMGLGNAISACQRRQPSKRSGDAKSAEICNLSAAGTQRGQTHTYVGSKWGRLRRQGWASAGGGWISCRMCGADLHSMRSTRSMRLTCGINSCVASLAPSPPHTAPTGLTPWRCAPPLSPHTCRSCTPQCCPGSHRQGRPGRASARRAAGDAAGSPPVHGTDQGAGQGTAGPVLSSAAAPAKAQHTCGDRGRVRMCERRVGSVSST